MPELPEVEALAHHLREHAIGTTVTRVDVASLTVLKTVQPAVTALHGCTVTGAGRHGKFLALHTSGPALVMHLARAGWLRWSDSLTPAAPRPKRAAETGSARPARSARSACGNCRRPCCRGRA